MYLFIGEKTSIYTHLSTVPSVFIKLQIKSTIAIAPRANNYFFCQYNYNLTVFSPKSVTLELELYKFPSGTRHEARLCWERLEDRGVCYNRRGRSLSSFVQRSRSFPKLAPKGAKVSTRATVLCRVTCVSHVNF
jgi:hypothetical protein